MWLDEFPDEDQANRMAEGPLGHCIVDIATAKSKVPCVQEIIVG
jgi:hypothetical protein